MTEIKNIINKTTFAEKIVTILGILTLIYIQLTTDSSFIALTTACLGIAYVLLVKYKSKHAMTIGAIQCALYAILAFQNRVFGDVILNTYNVCFLTYGYFQWSKNSNGDEVETRKLTKKQLIILIAATIGIYSIMTLILTKLQSYNPYLDAFNTTFSCIAMFLCTTRFSAQWFYWNCTNISSLILYTSLWISGSNVLPMAIMFSLYLLNSLHATYIWYKK